MITDKTPDERLDAVFSAISEMFIASQEYQASLRIFLTDNQVLALPSNSFMSSSDTKLILSYTCQFLCIMLGNVSFVTLETEAYQVSQKVVGEMTKQDAAKFYDSVIEQYGSLSNSPHAEEILTVMYDDGVNALQRSGRIVTTDNNKKSLDTNAFGASIKVMTTRTRPQENIFGGLLTQANELKREISDVVDAAPKMPKDVSGKDLYELISKSISVSLGMQHPYVGCCLALDVYRDFKGSWPEHPALPRVNKH